MLELFNTSSIVYVSDIVIEELKRVIKESEILK